ncbi:MAG: sugar-binding protein [Phycisphaerales bacterium]
MTMRRFSKSVTLFDNLEPRQLLAADPITPDNPLWIALPGTITIDGVLSEADWSKAFTVERSQPYRNNSALTMKLLYDANGLFIAFDVKDTQLWTDGRGAGIALPYEVETDDSMTVYFDPDDSRDQYFQSGDRAFGVNLGNPTDPTLGQGAIQLKKHVKGDGAGGAPDVNGGVLPTGLTWKTTRNGTLNNNADTDVGWVTEMYLPWVAMGLSSAPVNGQTIGMNFDVIFDNEGQTRDFTDHRNSSDRFTSPTFVDDHIQGVNSSYDASLSGIRGPVNYAELMFVDPSAASKPATISNLAAANVSGYSAFLNFTAPAGVSTSGKGHVSAYEIRYSESAISTVGDWLGATKFANAYVPRLAGLSESLRLIGLLPQTTYYVAVRAVDAAGNLGDLSNVATFTTQTLSQDVSFGKRVVPSPMGRTFVTEAGAPYIPVGDHLGLSWKYTRTLFPGQVWDNTNGGYHNYNTDLPAEGAAAPYFDALATSGVNIMRVFLELQNVLFPPSLPNGTYWLEYPAQTYNSNMRSFMLNALQQADRANMYLIFSPFDTFSFDEAFNTEFAWSAAKGGPLTDINDFFQTDAVLDLAKARMAQLISWLGESAFKPYAHRLIGWEVLNEWDSYEWTLNSEGDSESGRETEMRHRAQFVTQLADYVHAQDPRRLTLNSTIAQDPRGPLARADFNSRSFDAAVPHLYTNSTDEPINNPDTDTSIRPAIENAQLTGYWMTHMESHRPILDGEWGMNRVDWPGGVPAYSASFTQAEDEAIYRTMMWSGLASGQAGMGLRITTDELTFNGNLLTTNMRNSQKTFSNFVTDDTLQLDYTNFNFRSLSGRLAATGTANGTAGTSLLSWGVSDGSQGVLYVLKDSRSFSGNVTAGSVTITGLRADQVIDIEIWSTAAGTTAATSTVSGKFVSSGTLTFDLPTFSSDVAIKFKARAANNLTQRVVGVDFNSQLLEFYLDEGEQPMLRIQNNSGGTVSTQNLAAKTGFVGRVIDMTPIAWAGTIHLTLTDQNHHLWLLTASNLDTGAWTGIDLTALIAAPGLTGDLTAYSPSWGAIHLAGLDQRGHSINYWYAPGSTDTWQFSDLTDMFSGPTMNGGLTAFVTGWDGLNIAGLNSNNEVITYWWAPGLSTWQTLNMTTQFSGPTLRGQLDAYVTPWGGLNIAGRTADNKIYSYWWAPGMGGNWVVSNILDAAGSSTVVSQAIEVVVSTDGGINMAFLDNSSKLHMLRWAPTNQNWRDLSPDSSAPAMSMPLGSSASGSRLHLAGRSANSDHELVVFDFLFSPSEVWSYSETGVALEI